ncbi:hypothetical protein FSP39_009351 [Pinctada imbricata]|uniref:Non-specific serine/threonine protein kinase n=1 Tax=Pinctada imbricata TaxID=66713 RepID=A0AA88XNR2_PINIB|nr:hypothetical protein FSP39_009351 [Pinctada imbricata]
MGIEGIYRRACEVTLRVMRNQNDPLMSVLKPLVYDPLVEWSRGQKGQKASSGDDKSKGEITNDQAMTHVQNIEHRLKGILKSSRQSKPRSIPLSIEGHVRHLIQEASDNRNLCQMYVGWAAFM